MKNFFKPEDFEGNDNFDGFTFSDNREKASSIANEKLNAAIESWPVVYGQLPVSGFSWTGPKQWYDTHKARLAFIEEIVKEPCKHEPIGDCYVSSGVIKCQHCGVRLQATWSEKK